MSVPLLEPLELNIGYNYNLNNIKEIEVTDSFLTLDENTRNCQNIDTIHDCKTRKYLNDVFRSYKCFPQKVECNGEFLYHFSTFLEAILHNRQTY